MRTRAVGRQHYCLPWVCYIYVLALPMHVALYACVCRQVQARLLAMTDAAVYNVTYKDCKLKRRISFDAIASARAAP